MNSIKRKTAMATGATALFAMGIAQADNSPELRTGSDRLELNAALSGQTRASTRIIHDYTGFAGSRANASNLVMGLQGANHDLIALHLHSVGVESALRMPVDNGL